MLTNEFTDKEKSLNYHKSNSEIEREIAEEKIVANGLDQSQEDGLEKPSIEDSSLQPDDEATLLTPTSNKKIINIKFPDE